MNRLKINQIRHYDNFVYNVSTRIFKKVKRMHINNVLNLIKTNPALYNKCLYLACGSGYEIELLGGDGIGVDISFNCIKKTVALGFRGVVGDVEYLPLVDNSFDYVFSNSFHHFYNSNNAFSEMYRVCKQGGRITLGPESHRYSIDQYLYNTIFNYWRYEKNLLKVTPKKLIHLFEEYKMKNIMFYFKDIDLIAVSDKVTTVFARLFKTLPNCLFFWAHFYITGIK